jgi:metal-responsive CopG/Arc/MetJ family transcriptional regulator
MSNTKKKIQISLSEQSLNRLEELCISLGHISNSSVISIALEKYYWEISKMQVNDSDVKIKKTGENIE